MANRPAPPPARRAAPRRPAKHAGSRPGAPRAPGGLGARPGAPSLTKKPQPPPDTGGGGGGGGGDQGGGGPDTGEDQDVDESNSGPTTENDNQPEATTPAAADDSSSADAASTDDSSAPAEEEKPYTPGAGAMVAMGAEGVEADPFTRKLLERLKRTQQATSRRQAILQPNKGAGVQVERYTMGVIPTDANGNPQVITAFHSTVIPIALSGSRSPDCHFRPQRVTTNVPQPGLVMISMAKVANVSYIVGGQVDAWQFNANAWDEELDLPTLTPANAASFQGSALAAQIGGGVFTPIGGSFSTFQFALSFSGPALVTGLFAEGDLPKGLY